MPETSFQIEPVASAGDLEAARQLFSAYASSLGIDLAYQDFAAELEGLPGKYAPPEGALLLARDDLREAVGCVGLRPMMPGGCCEMKRLYVLPRARGLGLGKLLVGAVIAVATRIGHREMRLDTLPGMEGAMALYKNSGFKPIGPYYDTPIAGTIFLSRPLTL